MRHIGIDFDRIDDAARLVPVLRPNPDDDGRALNVVDGRRVHRRRSKANAVDPETAFCAEIVAMSYAAMGLLPADRDPSWYDPGRFWSGDRLPLTDGAQLGKEIEVIIPSAAVP